MRILWLKSDLLLPLDAGGRLRTWHLMRHLAARHTITYVSFAAPDTPADRLDGMREVAARVLTVPRTDPPKRSPAFYADAAFHLADPLPYAVGKYRSRAYRALVRRLLAAERFDVIVCDFLVPAVNLPRTLPCPAVLFTHNVEAEIWRRHAQTQTHTLSRWLMASQHRRMRRFEADTLARFDGVLAVSDADVATFGRLYPGAARCPMRVVLTGVDTHYFSPADAPAGANELVFTGSMDWLPNEDAMRFFHGDVLPLLRAEVPDARLTIAGRAPTPAVRALAGDPAVRVTGRVDDVRPFMAAAAVYVVPLRIGGGTRLKIFEAMSMGKAVVSTRVGAEGLPVSDGEHLVLADGPRAFASEIARLVRNPARRRELGEAARAFVTTRYDWSAVAASLEESLLRFARESDAARDRVANSRQRMSACA